MKTLLIGGPGHLRVVEADGTAQTFEWRQAGQVHRYCRKAGLDRDGHSARAFFVHPDLSEGEAAALIMMAVHPG